MPAPRALTALVLCAVVLAGYLPMEKATADASAAPACQCRAPDGKRRDLGAVECVNIAGRQYLVRCEMSTNTPYWKRLRDDAGCPLAAAL